MVIGLAIMVVGSLLFIPAATTANYSFFLDALFVLGTGLTILQTASNPYLVHVGPKETAAVRISIMGIVNKCAGVLVPILFTTFVLSGMSDFSEEHLASLDAIARAAQIEELSSHLISPYIYMAIVLTGLIVLVKYSHLPELHIEEEKSEVENTKGILHYPQAILGAVALFSYVGVEVIAADTIGLYGSGIGVEHFASLTSYTMVCMVIGYIIGTVAIPRYLTQKTALTASAIAGSLCILGVVMSSTTSTSIAELIWGWSGILVIPNSITFVALMGLSHALVWPSIWPLALEGLGKYTAQGSALLIMGIAGGALLPLLFGAVAQSFDDMQLAYWVALPCYLFILFYALKGHKMRSWK